MFLILSLLKTYSMDSKLINKAKIGLHELYYLIVHQFYIQWWIHLKKLKLKICPIHCPYIPIHFYSESFYF